MEIDSISHLLDYAGVKSSLAQTSDSSSVQIELEPNLPRQFMTPRSRCISSRCDVESISIESFVPRLPENLTDPSSRFPSSPFPRLPENLTGPRDRIDSRSPKWSSIKAEVNFTISITNNDPYTSSPAEVGVCFSNSQTTRRCEPPTLRARSITELELIPCLQKEDLDCTTALH